MFRYGWTSLVLLVGTISGQAALMPLSTSGGTVVPAKQDSVALHEVAVHSDSSGDLEWVFRLGASPPESLTVLVGFPGADTLVMKGIRDSLLSSRRMDCYLPGKENSFPLSVYPINFPAKTVSVITLKAITPNPWTRIQGGNPGETDIWKAVIALEGLSSWSGVVDRAQFVLDLPRELQRAWLADSTKIQFSMSPPGKTTSDGRVIWEYQNWEPTDSLLVQVCYYLPMISELELLDPTRIPLPELYVGDRMVYGDSLVNGFARIPEFNTLQTNEEKRIFAVAYLWIRQNEILARHGFNFKGDATLDSYFSKQSWYKPNANFEAKNLTPIEMQNYWKLISRQVDFQPQRADTTHK
jgi:hypothetical protein